MGVLLVGSLNIDLVAYVGKMPKPGETIHGEKLEIFPGGKGLNQATAAARAGGEVTMVGVLGTDQNSLLLRNVMRSEKINQEYVTEIEGVCGTAIIEVDTSGQNRIIVISGANGELKSDSITDDVFDSISDTRDLLAQLESPLSEIAIIISRAKDKGFFTILNPAPAQAVSHEFAQNIDLLVPNQFEAEFLTGIEVVDIESATLAAKIIHELGVGSVLITLGKDGALLHSLHGSKYFPPFKVTALDTTAAGDAFCGALATMLSEGLSLIDSIPFASAAGALATTKVGATPSLPTKVEISSLIQLQNTKGQDEC